MSELDSFLDDDVTEEAEVVEELAEVTPDETETESTVETESEETEEVGSPTEPEKPEAKEVPLAALLDERDKRQSLQKQLDELRTQTPEVKQEIPSVFDDEAGFNKSIDDRIDAKVQARLNQASASRAQRKYGDEFEAKLAEANEFLNSNPSIANEVLSGDDPMEAAFERHAQYKESLQLNDPNYREKLKAEIKAEALKEIQAELDGDLKAKTEKDKLTESLTPSLAGQKAVGGNTVVAKAVEDPLETTFNR